MNHRDQEIYYLAHMLDEAFDDEKQHLTESFDVQLDQIDQTDATEKQVWQNCSGLPRTYGFTSIIWHWYLKDRRSMSKEQLKEQYIRNFKELVDNLDLYQKYAEDIGVDSFKVNGLDFKIKDNAGLQRLRSARGLYAVIQKMYEIMSQNSVEDESTPAKFRFTNTDYQNIELLGSTANMTVWRTKTFDSTNKFIYSIWRNSNMNTPYRNGRDDSACKINSPYCTRIEDHWKFYSKNNPDYEQFWFFLKTDPAVPNGMLAHEAVQKYLLSMKNRGYELLVGLTDTRNKNNDRYDNELRGNYSKMPDQKGRNLGPEIKKQVFRKLLFLNRKIENNDENIRIISYISHIKSDNSLMSELPTRILGDFYCSDCQLTSLDGTPSEIKLSFDCSRNQLISLEGAPSEVGGDFDCRGNQLTSLKGVPSKVGGNFICNCNQLASLEFAPSEVGRDFACDGNWLTSLEFAPSEVGRDFDCCDNQLTSLEGAPSEVNGNFYCFYNQLISLEFAPFKVGGDFDCSYNKIESLKGAPSEVGQNFICIDNRLTSLEGAPSKVGGSFRCSDNQLSQKQIDDYKAFLKNPTPDLMDETGHYRPKDENIKESREYQMKKLHESRYFNGNGAVCYYNGSWHDSVGNSIQISQDKEYDIVLDMAEMESVNYASMPGYIMLDGYESIDEIAEDYLLCEPDDAFAYFSGTAHASKFQTNKQLGKATPVSQTQEYANSLYLLASISPLDTLIDFDIPIIGSKPVVELADINGHLTRNTVSVFDMLVGWMNSKNAIAVYCDARAGTSNKILNSVVGRRLLQKYGLKDINDFTLTEQDGTDDRMISRVFINMKWYNSLNFAVKTAIKAAFRRIAWSLG